MTPLLTITYIIERNFLVREYEAYHIHSHLTNLRISDSAVSKKDYAVRMREIGNMYRLSTCEHGWQGDVFYANDVCEAMAKDGYNMRPVQVSEAYFVKDRFEKDNTNAHIVLIAVNNEGRREMNYILHEGNYTGFYYQPRIDLNLLLSVDPRNIIVTTACISGVWRYSGGAEWRRIIETLRGHFGDNFYLEVQPHDTDEQKELNQRILNLYMKHGYQMIAGTDSHFINPEDSTERDNYIESKGIKYPEETGWDLSLPTADEFFDKFVKQGVLSGAQIDSAIANTLILRTCNSPEHGTEYVLTRNKKIPNLYKGFDVAGRINLCKRRMFDNYNAMYPDATPEQREEMFEALRHESKSIEATVDENTPMADYFLTMADIVNRGRELGGIMTTTGRGSASSFVTNHLLGITSVNRLEAPVEMYADRFISTDRIEAGSLPDVDLNCAEQEPFVRAAQEKLGEWGVLPMIAYSKLQNASAWKMYARAKGVDPETANTVSKGIQQFERAVKYAKEQYEDEGEADIEDEYYGVDMANYVPEEYMSMVIESQDYMGIIDGYSPHACAHLLLDGDIRYEIGTVRLKSQDGVTSVAAAIDGATAEKYGYLKMDFLVVTVVDVIQRSFAALGMEVPSERKLLDMANNDPQVWEMYAKGYTMGLNQVEQQATTERVMRYKPRNIEELTAFVAAVRPGFKSMLDIFLSRSNFSYNIPALDKLLQTENMPFSFLIYQEQVMKVLQAAGISAAESYNCIKAISKKSAEKIHSYKEEFLEGFTRYIVSEDNLTAEQARHASETVWGIVEDNASYSFNSSHAYCVALDSLYGAWLKAHHPYEFYMALLKSYTDKGDKDRIAMLKNEMFEAYGIRIIPPKYGMDNRNYVVDRENKAIFDALTSVKHIGKPTAESLYEHGHHEFGRFVDLLEHFCYVSNVTKKHINILIRIGYFEQYGSMGKLLAIHDAFLEGPDKYKKTYVDATKEKRMAALREFEDNAEAEDLSPAEIVAFEIEHLGLPATTWPDSRMAYVAVDIDDKYSPKIKLTNLSTGRTGMMKTYKNKYLLNKINVGDIVHILVWTQKPSYRTKTGYLVPASLYMDEYEVYSAHSPHSEEKLKKILGIK